MTKNYETESFRRSIERAKKLILDLLGEKRYLLRRSIQVILEENHSLWQTVTWNALGELKDSGKIRLAKFPKRGSYPVWVYQESLRLDDIKDEISNESLPIWSEFMNINSEMSSHSENIFEMALGEAGFVIVSRRDGTRYFNQKLSPGGTNLEYIALQDGVFYGIEVKQKIPYPDFERILSDKKFVADFHGIQFLLISRRLGPYSYRLFQKKGLYFEFGKLFWTAENSSFAQRCKETLYYPIECIDHPPSYLTDGLKAIPKIHDKYFHEIGRI